MGKCFTVLSVNNLVSIVFLKEDSELLKKVEKVKTCYWACNNVINMQSMFFKQGYFGLFIDLKKSHDRFIVVKFQIFFTVSQLRVPTFSLK